MAPVDLGRNGASMLKAYKEVSDPNNKTNWALYGYEGQTDVLKFVGQGDGGIPELIDELNSGKIMYAYVKVLDPNTNLSKFVFINWQGEGVPENRKGACASHVRDVENLFRGAHVTINARNEDDVDEDLIKSKVSKASGANYSFHKEKKQAMPEIGPVGSVYQKVKPQIEIKPRLREKFWEETQKEEQNRLMMEKKRRDSEKENLDKEIKEREVKAAKAREEKEAERMKHIREIRDAEKTANAVNKSKEQAGWDPEDARRAEDERAQRSEQMRKERAAEAKSVASGRAADARAMFEQKPTSQFDAPNKAPAPSRKIKSSFLEESNTPSEPAGRKQPIKLPGQDEQAVREQPVSPPISRQPEPAPVRRPASPPHAVAQENEEEEELYDEGFSGRAPQRPASNIQPPDDDEIYDDAATVRPGASYQAPSSGPAPRNLLAEGMPKRAPSDDEEEQDEQDWESPAAGDSGVKADHEDVKAHHDNVPQPGRQEICARALYDYQAAEDNEITFDPDDIITDIEMIDEGWWLGTGPDGTRGMFPSNYVERI